MITNRKRITRLEIKPKEMRKRLIALFDKIDKDEKIRESFIRNPSQYISNDVMNQNLPPQQLSEANRLLFSLMSNDTMLEWLKTYQSQEVGAKFNKKQFLQDFAKKIAALGDENIIASIVSNASLGYGIPGLGDVAYQCVYNETPNKYEFACTPVSKDPKVPGLNIRPEMLRALTDSLIDHAKELGNSSLSGAILLVMFNPNEFTNLCCQMKVG